ncbi:MAG: ABC transporter permease [Actinomycetota bacterium]|nr:ABC transporter permease [Actinomycetota bacterium]
MRTGQLARRNLKSLLRDPLSLGLALVLPVGMLLILIAVGNAVGETEAPWMTATVLTPGIALFGYVMLMFSSAMALSRDRDSALLDRMITTPVSASDFIAGYSLPYLPVALAQTVVLFVIGTFFGLVMVGSVGLVLVVLGLMAVFYIALGMIFGTTLTVNQVSGAYSAVLLLTIFGGAWIDLSALGGAFEAVANLFPFAHALDATRAVMAHGAGLGEIASDLAWVIGYTLAAAAAAVWLFRRQMIR